MLLLIMNKLYAETDTGHNGTASTAKHVFRQKNVRRDKACSERISEKAWIMPMYKADILHFRSQSAVFSDRILSRILPAVGVTASPPFPVSR